MRARLLDRVAFLDSGGERQQGVVVAEGDGDRPYLVVVGSETYEVLEKDIVSVIRRK